MAFIDVEFRQGQPLRALLKNSTPQADGSGQLVGPWGDAIRAAVLREKQGQEFEDGAAGQVLEFLNECGHSKYEEQADATEKATHQLSEDQIEALLCAPQVMGIPQDAWEAPSQQMMGEGMKQVGHLLDSHDEVEVRQVNFGGCDCCCCCRKNPCKGFPCCCCLATSEFEINDMAGNPILIAYEESGVWERNCCKPNHSLMMKVLQAPAVPPQTSLWEMDFDEVYKGLPKLLTLERKGCSNCYCTQCFSCCECCNDNIAVYEGDVKGKPGNLENAPAMQTMMKQPIGGGLFTPTINIEPKASPDGAMTVRGPCVFGGWAEICCDANFKVSRDAGGEDVATIKHKTPDGCCELCMAFLTPLDRYNVTFNKAGLSGNDKANVVISSFLVDYMFFELDDGPCYCGEDYIKCTFFFCNCCGCLMPCFIQCPKSKGEGGD